MQTQYVDKYENQLKVAIEKADYLPSVLQFEIPSYKYLGVFEGKYGKRHYYYKESEEKYYFEDDFAREMRLKIRNRRFQNYTKK